MVMVRYYGAVLEAAFHSYTDIRLLYSTAQVEHTANKKQMLSQEQRDVNVRRQSIMQNLITNSKGRQIYREGKCIIMVVSLLTCE